MLNNDPYSTAAMTETETSSPIATLPGSEAALEGLSAAVATGDPFSNRNLRQLLQEMGLVYPVYDWGTHRPSDPTDLKSLPNIVFLDIDSKPDLTFAHHLTKAQSGVHIIGCSARKELGPEHLLEAMRVGVCDLLRKPIDRAELRNTLTRILSQGRHIPAPTPTGKLFVVMGTKGGVGTSTVAVNLGVQLAQIPEKRTILLDFSRPLGDVSLLLDLAPQFRVWDAVLDVDRLDAHMLDRLVIGHKSGLQVLAGAAHPDEWQQTSVSSLARLITVALGHFDFAVVDLGSMYSVEWKSILSSAEILLVAEADVPGLAKLERHLSVLSSFEVPFEKIRIVANRWHRQDEEALAVVEKNLRSPIFVRLPNDFHQVSKATMLGAALEKNARNLLITGFRKLAHRLAQVEPEASAKRGISGLWPFKSKTKGV